MGKCFVTRLKETVSDDSLKKLGEININLNNGEDRFNNLGVNNNGEEVKYEIVGDIVLSGGFPTAGVIPANTSNWGFSWTDGNGILKIWPKYNLQCQLNSSATVDANELAYMTNPTGIVARNVWDKVETDIYIGQFYTYGFTLPLVLDGDYSKVHVTPGTPITQFIYDDDVPNKFNYKGAIDPILDKIAEIDNGEGNFKTFTLYENVSLINPAKLESLQSMTNFAIHSVTIQNVPAFINSLKTLRNLTKMVVIINNNENWDIKSVFDAWAAAGKTGTVTCWLNTSVIVDGTTYNLYNRTVSFANNSWTVQV